MIGSSVPENMRALQKVERSSGFELNEIKTPSPGANELLVRVQAATICGTDLHIFNWDDWAANRMNPPTTIGHEFCGVVVQRGEHVTQFNIGDFVSAESHVVCGTCQQCRTGKKHICPNTEIFGVDRDGFFADYAVIPAVNAWRNPVSMPVEIACLQENFGNSVHTSFTADVRAKTVLMTGCGPVGLMAIPVLKSLGATKVIVSDVSDYRLELAEKMKADIKVNPMNEDLLQRVLKETAGEGVDVLIEMSGAIKAINEGFQAVKRGGEVALLGLSPTPYEFDMNNQVIMRGITVYGIAGRRLWETWYQAQGLLESGVVDIRAVVTHEYSLDNWEDAFNMMLSGRSGKVVVRP